MKLQLNPLPLKKFTFDKNKRTLVAEMSDFGPLRDGRWWLQRIYDDACDVGIAIASELTGKTETFCLVREEINSENELIALHFIPLDELANVDTVIIFND